MSGILRECECGTLNHVWVNSERCYSCGLEWGEQSRYPGGVFSGP